MSSTEEIRGFLAKLVEWAGSRKEFCRLTGIKQSNLSAYLAGTKNVSFERLRKAAERLFGEPPAFVPLLEVSPLLPRGPSKQLVGDDPGIYALFDSAHRAIYVGKASNLYTEIHQALRRKTKEVRALTSRKFSYRDLTSYISAYRISRSDSTFRHDLEALLLRLCVNNTFNDRAGKFKRKR